MAPNLVEFLNRDVIPDSNTINFPTPDSDSISLSDVEIWTNSDDTESDDNISIDWNIPLQNDLRDLLLKVTATENLETVTQVKLKVITREISLQQLSIYTPALRELILDGSYVSSLRDLGCGLKNLKILRLNRCSLYHLDSLSGVENLEELYATDNNLVDIAPCAFLSKIKIIDVRRNKITSMRSICFLSLCTELQHLYLEGNVVTSSQNFTEKIREALPSLPFLDSRNLEGMIINLLMDQLIITDCSLFYNKADDLNGNKETVKNVAVSNQVISTEERLGEATRELRSFSIQFPPRVLTDNPRGSQI